MPRQFHDPGALNIRLEIQSLVETPDGGGGLLTTWQHVAHVWGHILNGRQNRKVHAHQVSEEVNALVTIRFRNDVQSGWRFLFGERQLQILSAEDMDESGRYLVCETREEGR